MLRIACLSLLAGLLVFLYALRTFVTGLLKDEGRIGSLGNSLWGITCSSYKGRRMRFQRDTDLRNDTPQERAVPWSRLEKPAVLAKPLASLAGSR